MLLLAMVLGGLTLQAQVDFGAREKWALPQF
jgi:hypothetical protein